MPKANPNTQPPTVGRICWVWMTDEDRDSHGLEWKSIDQPFRAEVLWVDTSTLPPLAHLRVTDHEGEDSIIDNVQIFDPEETDKHDDAESYATWMPYQKAQHDKAAAAQMFQEAKAEEKMIAAAGEDARDGFGVALEACQAGARIAREGWNGKGMWVEYQTPDDHSKMTMPYLYLNYPVGSGPYPQGARVPWLASQTDILARDWVVSLPA
jgi:hypothetical protein